MSTVYVCSKILMNLFWKCNWKAIIEFMKDSKKNHQSSMTKELSKFRYSPFNLSWVQTIDNLGFLTRPYHKFRLVDKGILCSKCSINCYMKTATRMYLKLGRVIFVPNFLGCLKSPRLLIYSKCLASHLTISCFAPTFKTTIKASWTVSKFIPIFSLQNIYIYLKCFFSLT